MRRKAVEKLIDARIARQVRLLRGELDEAVETMYRNGGDRRSDPNRADRNPS